MSARRNLKLATLSTLMLLAASCGNDKGHSRSSVVKNPVCEGISCLNSITWKIQLQGNMFPEKSRVEINNLTVLDECMSKQQYHIDRNAAPQSITLDNYTVPKGGRVKVLVVDQGWDCQKEDTFIRNDNAKYDVVKSLAGPEILISL